MKKYIIFAVSFILLFLLFQVISGILLTLTYTPDIMEAWNLGVVSEETVIIKRGLISYVLSFFIAFLSASAAYFISKKLGIKRV